jgi:hypothetical protein
VVWPQIAAQLDVNAAMKAILRGAASSPAHDHFLNAYETGLRVTHDRVLIFGSTEMPFAE